MKITASKLQGAWRSMTVRVNTFFLVLIAVLPELLAYLIQNAPALQPHLGPESYQQVMFVMGAINILLRFRTSVPLEAK